jgi:hypothetical protein
MCICVDSAPKTSCVCLPFCRDEARATAHDCRIPHHARDGSPTIHANVRSIWSDTRSSSSKRMWRSIETETEKGYTGFAMTLRLCPYTIFDSRDARMTMWLSRRGKILELGPNMPQEIRDANPTKIKLGNCRYSNVFRLFSM